MENSNARMVLGLALGFVGGLTVGWLLPSIEEADTRTIVAPSSARVDEQRAPARSTAFASEPERRVARASSAPVTPVSDARVDQLTRDVEVPSVEHEAGSAAIFGRIADAQQRGVPDVVLRATPSSSSTRSVMPSSVGQGPPPLSDLKQAMRDTARQHAETLARTHETRSDPSGAYRFEGLPEGHYRILAYKLDHVVRAGEGSGYDVPTGTELDFLVRPVLRVPVSVILPDGSAAASAILSCTPLDDERPRDKNYDWSPSEPELRLVPGSYEIAAHGALLDTNRYSRELASKLRSEPQRVELVSGAPSSPLTFVLSGRAGIRGRVSFAKDGVTGANARVKLLPVGPTGEVDLQLLADSGESESLRGSDDYAFLDLEPGRYAVGVTRIYNNDVCVHALVEVDDGIVNCDLDVPPIDLSRYLSVLVFGSGGEPLADVDFRFLHRSGPSSDSSGSRSMRGPDGSHIVPISENAREHYFAGTEGHSFSLVLSNDEFGSKVVELTPGQIELELSFAAPARLDVLVAGYESSAYVGRLRLDLERAQEEWSPYWTGSKGDALGSSGNYSFEAEEPGEYELTLTLTGKKGPRFSRQQLIHCQRVQLASGPNSARVTIPALYPVPVHYVGEAVATGARIQRHGLESGIAARIGADWAELDADGFGRFAAIPAGSYTISVWDGSGGTTTEDIEVPCGEVELRPE